jgi:hypothetical protein
MKAKSLSLAFFYFQLFFRIGAFQWVTGEKTRIYRHASQVERKTPRAALFSYLRGRRAWRGGSNGEAILSLPKIVAIVSGFGKKMSTNSRIPLEPGRFSIEKLAGSLEQIAFGSNRDRHREAYRGPPC